MRKVGFFGKRGEEPVHNYITGINEKGGII